jgi:1-deoxy-D-xylulose-5-phosphate synthase
VIRYPRSAGVGGPLLRPIVPLEGPWVDIVRDGSDVLLLSVGPEIRIAEQAAGLLAEKGIEATVAGVRRVHPLDVDVLAGLLEGHRAVVTVEDNILAGGFGSAVMELMADLGLQRPMARAGLPDAFVPQGSVDLLRSDVGLTAEAVAASAGRLVRKAPRKRS